MKLPLRRFLSENTSRPARARARTLLPSALLTLACAGLAHGQSAQTPPPTPVAPAATTRAPQEKSFGPWPPAAPAQRRPGAAPAAAPGTPAPQTPGAAPLPPGAPRNVVTVVHRLNGWKLLSWLAARGGEGVMVDELPSPEEMHTNIVAGFVSDDGRTVMARLPRAEAEVEAFALPTMPPGIFASTTPREFDRGGFTLIRGDGLSVEAKFVGLDASTGLSLLEAAEPLVAPAPKALVGVPSIGQRVRLYAPAPATPPPAAVAMPAPAAPPAVAAGETGDTGVIYVGIGETEGQLTAVKRAPSGLPLAATVKATRITPAWAGAVVTNAAGELVGIAGDSGDTESQVVPAEVVRQAKERVLARRASVPQPWLGVRGDAVSRTTVEQFLAQGWPREFARSLLNERRGLLLTSVAPDTPAALAGLRPGDVISRVGEIDVRGVEDFSMLIREAGAGAKLNMTVLRALTNAPLKFTVELRGTKDPAQAMADAMAWARPNALAPYGVETVGLTARVASRLGASGGLLVVHVREESPAASAGLKAWDVIETVNGAPVTWVQWPRPTPGADGDVNLGVVRDGQKMKFALKRMEE